MGASGSWEYVGPWNIGDDVTGHGESGTLADAVSPASNPKLIFTGGQNNGASSGVLKSVDGGEHWTYSSKGMYETKVMSLGLADATGDHVYVGCAGVVYESVDQGDSWTEVNGSRQWGTCHTFKNGTINGEAYVLAGCDAGIANVPAKAKGGSFPGAWSLIPTGVGRAYLSVSDSLLSTSVLGSCAGGFVNLGTIVNTTYANWTSNHAAARTLESSLGLIISYARGLMLHRHPESPLHDDRLQPE